MKTLSHATLMATISALALTTAPAFAQQAGQPAEAASADEGSTIIVNNTRLSPPYEIRAIGNPSAIEDALRDPATLKKLKSKSKLYGVQFKFSQAKDLALPAYTGGVTIKYANPAGK